MKNNKVVAFMPAQQIYYRGVDIFEFCWRKFFKNGYVNLAEIFSDKDNLMIPKNIQVSRLNDIIKILENRFDHSECESLDEVFGEEDLYTGAESDIFADEYNDLALDDYNVVDVMDKTGIFDAYLSLAELEDALFPEEDEWIEEEIDEMLNELFADEEE